MLQRMIAAVLGVLGLAAIGLGVASATLWRGDDTLVVSAPVSDSGTLVVTAPGVLELGGGPVTITARAHGGSKVVLAIGREADVTAWVGADAHTVLTGLANLHTLKTTPVGSQPAATGAATAPTDAATPPAATPAPDPDGSDMWARQAAGATTATLTWTPVAGRWTLLAAGAGEGAAAPSVVLSWPQTVSTPWLVPGVVVGSILLLLGLGWGLQLWRRARRGDPDWHRVDTGAVPVLATAQAGAMSGSDAAIGPDRDLDDAPTMILTRRQMREAAAARPAPRTASRLTLRWRGESGSTATSAARTGETQAVAAPAAVTPAPLMAAAPVAAEPAVAAPAVDAPARSRFGAGGWVPRRPHKLTEGSPATKEKAHPDAPGASAVPVPTAVPIPMAQPAAPGSRADAWRRAWGFPGEGAAEASDASGSAEDASPSDSTPPRKDT